ncbi:hypothetical protein [Tunturiibacter gelidiferens]|uniref:hypothetical protein n=1 Tax=Tunturiibacter gelidiferens TaxID=3069689 RepID=UPI003D9BA6C8
MTRRSREQFDHLQHVLLFVIHLVCAHCRCIDAKLDEVNEVGPGIKPPGDEFNIGE